MQIPDLSPLIKGVIVIVGMAIATGQYGRLESWARVQALHAVAWSEPLPYFFAQPSGMSAHRALRLAQKAAHSKTPQSRANWPSGNE